MIMTINIVVVVVVVGLSSTIIDSVTKYKLSTKIQNKTLIT